MTASVSLQAPPLSAAIADRIRHDILQGRWSPGEDILDGELAARYGVSRTPVREAMKLLCHEGLLSAHPRRGMTLATLSPAQIAEAQALSQWLHSFRAQHPHVDGGLAQRMLDMAQQRLQLAQLHA